MSFQERLECLIGHEIIVIQTNEPANEDGTQGTPPGRCREVGPGFIVLETVSEEDGGNEGLTGCEFVVNTEFVARIIHMTLECSGCLMATVTQ